MRTFACVRRAYFIAASSGWFSSRLPSTRTCNMESAACSSALPVPRRWKPQEISEKCKMKSEKNRNRARGRTCTLFTFNFSLFTAFSPGHHNINQFPRHHDNLFYVLASDVFLHGRIGQRQLAHMRFV